MEKQKPISLALWGFNYTGQTWWFIFSSFVYSWLISFRHFKTEKLKSIMQLLSDISCIIQQPCWTNIKLKIYSCHLRRISDKNKEETGCGTVLWGYLLQHKEQFMDFFFVVQPYLKNIKKKITGKYLIQPFPLEWNSDLYENCNDPCEVNVTHNLRRKRTKQKWEQ